MHSNSTRWLAQPAIWLTIMAFAFIQCTDEIDPDLESADPIVNVDAWLTNKPGTQTISVTFTLDYDENDQLPPGVKGAFVSITDDLGKTFSFIEDTQKGDGSYVWTPALPSEVFGEVGREYTLTVVYNGETFQSVSKMGDVPNVDSITYEYEDDNPFFEEGYTAEFWARDLPGEGNTYWIKASKNGIALNKPGEINIAYDAGISPGSGNDGKIFLPPIRLGINPNDEDEDENPLPPYEIGDVITVEIHSITLSAFNYLNEVIDNTDRQTGIGSLFSTPLSNVSTNIRNLNPAGSKVVGFFNTASVKANEVTVQ
jgi:hypothetical protein